MKVLIVDDEPWARKRISMLLAGESDVVIVGECSGGLEAIEKINALSPDLVFLDVQMPEADGFAVVEAVGPERMPLVIFATAYDQYALRAFEAQAIDYLLKPFDEERFRRSLERARRDLGKGTVAASLRSLLDSLSSGKGFLQRMVVKSRGRVIFLKVAEVDWFEAAGNYITLHAGRDDHLVRDTMNALEPRLDPDQFVRIHRGTIVNLDRIKEIQPWFRGEQLLVLLDGRELRVGRGYRDRIRHFLENRVRGGK